MSMGEQRPRRGGIGGENGPGVTRSRRSSGVRDPSSDDGGREALPAPLAGAVRRRRGRSRGTIDGGSGGGGGGDGGSAKKCGAQTEGSDGDGTDNEDTKAGLDDVGAADTAPPSAVTAATAAATADAGVGAAATATVATTLVDSGRAPTPVSSSRGWLTTDARHASTPTATNGSRGGSDNGGGGGGGIGDESRISSRTRTLTHASSAASFFNGRASRSPSASAAAAIASAAGTAAAVAATATAAAAAAAASTTPSSTYGNARKRGACPGPGSLREDPPRTPRSFQDGEVQGWMAPLVCGRGSGGGAGTSGGGSGGRTSTTSWAAGVAASTALGSRFATVAHSRGVGVGGVGGGRGDGTIGGGIGGRWASRARGRGRGRGRHQEVRASDTLRQRRRRQQQHEREEEQQQQRQRRRYHKKEEEEGEGERQCTLGDSSEEEEDVEDGGVWPRVRGWAGGVIGVGSDADGEEGSISSSSEPDQVVDRGGSDGVGGDRGEICGRRRSQRRFSTAGGVVGKGVIGAQEEDKGEGAGEGEREVGKEDVIGDGGGPGGANVIESSHGGDQGLGERLGGGSDGGSGSSSDDDGGGGGSVIDSAEGDTDQSAWQEGESSSSVEDAGSAAGDGSDCGGDSADDSAEVVGVIEEGEEGREGKGERERGEQKMKEGEAVGKEEGGKGKALRERAEEVVVEASTTAAAVEAPKADRKAEGEPSALVDAARETVAREENTAIAAPLVGLELSPRAKRRAVSNKIHHQDRVVDDAGGDGEGEKTGHR